MFSLENLWHIISLNRRIVSAGVLKYLGKNARSLSGGRYLRIEGGIVNAEAFKFSGYG